MLCLAILTVHHSHTRTAVFVLDSVYIEDAYHHEVASTTTCMKKARKVMATTPCRVSMALTQPEEDGLFMKSILKEKLWKEQIKLVSWFIKGSTLSEGSVLHNLTLYASTGTHEHVNIHS